MGFWEGALFGGAGEKDLGAPERIKGVGGRRAYTNAEGQRVYRPLTPAEQQATGWTAQSDATWIAKQEALDLEARTISAADRRQGIADAHRADDRAFQNKQLQATIDSSANANELTRQQIQAGITRDANSNAVAIKTLELQGDQHKDAMTIRNDELRMSREQMQLNNQLQDRKLTMEDRHFQQQAALDHKNSRRTQVMNALTLIAQSAAKL